MNSNVHSKLIGFSGKLNGGKDFSAQLCQGLIAGYKGQEAIQFAQDVGKLNRAAISGFETVAFADKLKKMCSIATGTHLNDWYDREKKEEMLPEPFHRYSLRTFMTTFARGFDEIDKDFFPKSLFADYRHTPGTKGMFGVPDQRFKPNWLITDVRFPNEAEAIIDQGGIVVRINRPLWNRHEYAAIEDVQKEDPELYKKLTNSTEIALDAYPFEYTIEWTDNVLELVNLLEELLREQNIID
jgi:hypothetical protein